MFQKKTVKDVDVAGKVILLRTDYNVPIDYVGLAPQILNDFRIRQSLDTIEFLLKEGARKIVIISHMGRPNSVESMSDISELERTPSGERKYSLRPTFERLRELLAERSNRDLQEFKLNFPMNFHSMPIFDRTRYSVPIAAADDNYKIEMLENLRFSKSEKKDSSDLAEALAQVTGADLFVQDGFGVVHREHTSTHALAKRLPSVAGLLLEKEVSTINQAFSSPKKPFVAVMGGAKVGDKLPLISKFIEKSDNILLAGAMANTILADRGYNLGRSKIEPGQTGVIEEIYNAANLKITNNPSGVQYIEDFLILPTDLAVAHEFLPSSERRNKRITELNEHDVALDLGEESIKKIENALDSAETIVWNGTIGYIEFPNFTEGSARIAQKIAERTARGTLSIIGGGDTSAFALNWQAQSGAYPNQFTLISTGGGSALELMSGMILPGVEILPDKDSSFTN